MHCEILRIQYYLLRIFPRRSPLAAPEHGGEDDRGDEHHSGVGEAGEWRGLPHPGLHRGEGGSGPLQDRRQKGLPLPRSPQDMDQGWGITVLYMTRHSVMLKTLDIMYDD